MFSPASVGRCWLAWWVLLKIVYVLACWVLSLTVLVFRGVPAKDAELLVLWHENAVLRRHTGRYVWVPKTCHSRWPGVLSWIRVVRLDIGLREDVTIRHCQYSFRYDSPIWRCCACSAGSPCSPAPTAPRMARSSSCATKSPCSSDRSSHRGCPG